MWFRKRVPADPNPSNRAGHAYAEMQNSMSLRGSVAKEICNATQEVGLTPCVMADPVIDATRYIIEHNGLRAASLATPAEVGDFLDACGIFRETQKWHSALAGVPIDVDGDSTRFIAVNLPNGSTVPPEWIAHAYPLQQTHIDLQCTRHSSRQQLIDMLEKVLARLRTGDESGCEHDDDCGYRFTVINEALSSVFDEPYDIR